MIYVLLLFLPITSACPTTTTTTTPRALTFTVPKTVSMVKYGGGGFDGCPKIFSRCKTLNMESLELLLDEQTTYYDFDFGSSYKYINLKRTRTFKLDETYFAYLEVFSITFCN